MPLAMDMRCLCTCFPVDGRQRRFCMRDVRHFTSNFARGCGMWETCVRPTTLGSKYSHIIAILDIRFYYLHMFHNFGSQYYYRISGFTWTYSVNVCSWAF